MTISGIPLIGQYWVGNNLLVKRILGSV